jgi:hypothetical protein
MQARRATTFLASRKNTPPGIRSTPNAIEGDLEISRRTAIIGGVAALSLAAVPAHVFGLASHSDPSQCRIDGNQGDTRMSTFTTKDGTKIYYKDWGTGQPVVFSHGWPISADAWDAQMLFLGQQGYRVIAHDRRGHGRSPTERSPLSPTSAHKSIHALQTIFAGRSASFGKAWANQCDLSK